MMTFEERPSVGLFVTCLVDLFRPTIGFATVRLLKNAGCRVDVPVAQSCCGQPAFNMGDNNTATAFARGIVEVFDPFDFVVVPSGSCAAMLKKHLPELLANDKIHAENARAFSDKCYELTSFLVDVLNVSAIDGAFDGVVTYHDSCSGLRELGVKEQPRKLLRSMSGLTLNEMRECETCCGFGGSFSVKYPEISSAIATQKTSNVKASGASTVVAGDLGCLMNIAGKLQRERAEVEVRHVAEVLANALETPAIGMTAKKDAKE